jgi:hypothetical protein
MVSIVITHGRSQEFGIGETLEENWTRALRQGLGDAHAAFAEAIPVDFAFYGTLWRPDAAEFDAAGAERGGGDTERAEEAPPTDLQVAIADELFAAAPADARARTERFGWDTLARLVGNLDGVLGVGKVALKYFLEDIDRYFSDAGLRDKAIAKVVDTVGENSAPVVLLAHSLGTIVAYDALRRHPELPVPGLVTFGSPLGLATVRARLQETGGDLVYPPSVQHWANIYEKRDFVAAGIKLGPIYAAGDGRTIDDRTSAGMGPGIGNVVAAHDAIVYLSSAALATATRDIVDAVSPQAAANGGETAAPPAMREDVPETGGTRSIPATGHGRERRSFPDNGGNVDVDRGSGDAGGAAALPPDFGATAAEPDTAAADDGQPRRDVTRAAAASFPPLVAPGATETLSFQIGAPGMVRGDAMQQFSESLPVSMTSLDLTVVVQAPDFDVVDARGNLTSTAVPVSLDLTNDSALINGSFLLRAHETDQRMATDVRLRVLRDNNPVATISLPTLIAPGAATAPDRPAQLAGSMLLRESEAPGAELTLYINDRDGDDKFEITANFKGDAGVRPMYYLDSFPVEQGAWEFSRQILEQFRAAREIDDANERQKRIHALGLMLWDRLPEKFRDFYWQYVHGKVKTILLCSDEPYIPWELIEPRPPQGGEPAPMLGLAYKMGRWEDERPLPGAPLVVTDFVVIAPTYATNQLPSADQEANELVAQFHARREQPGNKSQVTDLFMTNSPQILHFSGHGKFENVGANSQISLADAALDTIDVATATFGQHPNPPLVFLNACEVGAQGWSLTKIGGWAEAFCQAGATGFVGPYWPVSDGVARKAAMVFYRSLQAGETVGQAMIRIRERYAQDDEFPYHPSWLAYSLHSHPNLRVQLSALAPTGD